MQGWQEDMAAMEPTYGALMVCLFYIILKFEKIVYFKFQEYLFLYFKSRMVTLL